MRPIISTNDAVYSYERHSELFAEIYAILFGLAQWPEFSYLTNIIFCEFGFYISRAYYRWMSQWKTSSPASLAQHILRIVLMRPFEQMIPVDARRIITGVQDESFIEGLIVLYTVCNSVSDSGFTLSMKSSVGQSLNNSGSHPWPTNIVGKSLWDVCLESFNIFLSQLGDWFSIASGHVISLTDHVFGAISGHTEMA